MKNWLERMRYKFSIFMQGRYGSDNLNMFLLVLAIICIVIELIMPTLILSALSWVLLILVLFRTFSKNRTKRAAENQKYLKIARGPKQWFARMDGRYKNRKTKKYFKCPKCRQSLSVPRGKGRLRVVCPKCGTEIFKNT